ncbi:hypothetical protein GALMADRAFT_242390 [Galerina marginata CBS 339.88]|uniref:Uncharacterized protein n=1 Tax=Galerina marginata (strain CBS 339.88) TaxID=685588 RepID=A0A067TME8_GALM3|nr:hypothetical protein GALMADRAFT_242390 [Galerina marginata CBS 339.88]
MSSEELLLAYNALLRLRDSLAYEDFVEADRNELSAVTPEQRLDIRQRLQQPPLSKISYENLLEMKITLSGVLSLKPNSMDRLAKTTSLAQNELWSSANLYRHLNYLDGTVPQGTGTDARPWIDAFFFRASAMLPPDKRMILTNGHTVPAMTVNPLNRLTVDYIAIVTNQCTASSVLRSPNHDMLRMYMLSGFLFIEARGFPLSADIPRAVSEMYASGKILQRKFLRGALTNGREWIFLLIKFNDDYEGASYMQSALIEFRSLRDFDGRVEAATPWPDVIAAILSDWASFILICMTIC